MLASVCSLERTAAIKFFPSRKYSEVIRLPHISRSRKASSKIFTFQLQTGNYSSFSCPKGHTKPDLELMYSFTWPLFRIPSARKLPFVVTKDILHCQNESVFKEKSFQSRIGVQWNPDFSDVSRNVSAYSDATNIFFHLFYYVNYFPYIFSLLFFLLWIIKKNYFFFPQWSSICVCIYRSILHLCNGSCIV